MRRIRVGAAVVNQTPLDWRGNARRIEAVLAEARERDVSLLCLPELCITGYGCEDMFHAAGVLERAEATLAALLPSTRGMAVCFGLPVRYLAAVFNAVALVVDGRLLGVVAKRHLAGDGVHYEPRWFRAWPDGGRGRMVLAGVEVPIGDLVFDVGGVRVGFEICRDAWVAERPGQSLSRRGVDVLLNPSASHFAFGKSDVRRAFVAEGSRAFGAATVYANLVGNEAGRTIYDGDALIASGGRIVAELPRFSYRDHGLLVGQIDIERERATRSREISYMPIIGDADGVVVEPFVLAQSGPLAPAAALPAWESGADRKYEEFSRAISLALFDYLRKSRSHGFVVSLSGGADSAACACLVAQMVGFARAELGAEAFAARLSHIDGIDAGDSDAAIVGRLLTCVYQATAHSSQTTRDAARGVAEAIGARFIELDVDELVEGYVARIGAALGRTLDWQHDDVALQNIQARVRGPSAWLLANLGGALLLATSNRSEAAVGYATMDGDTCGGLSPIAGIDKAFLRTWLGWLETQGPEGLAAIPALAAVNVQAPTAELRPPAEGQTDETDLMPYPVLDAIERAAIRDKRMPLEIWRSLMEDFVDAAPTDLALWVERFFVLWCRNQWKRERYAVSFHVDDENLDPRTWCRFPILSGGYEAELAELREAVAQTR